MDTKSKSDELDLGFILEKISNFFKSILRAAFNALNFIFRNWVILLILFAVGVGLAYYMNRKAMPSKSADVLVRVNFNAAEYAYNALDLLLLKSKEKDTAFLRKNGFRADTLEIKDLEILPVVSFTDIAEKYDPNDRSLETLLKNIEFEEDDDKVNSFRTAYKYHKIELKLSPTATNATVDRLMAYLNNQELIKEISKVGRQSIEEDIERNNNTFAQIDTVLSTYSKTQPMASPSSQIYVVDKNFNISQILELKLEIQEANRKLKEELVYASNTIVKLNNDPVYIENPGLLGNKYILYPLFLIFLFLFFSWIRHSYLYLKRISQE